MSIDRIHHLNCTTFRLRFARAFDGRRTILDDSLVYVSHCLLVETSHAGLVLIDAGFSTQEVDNPRRVPPIFRFVFRPPWRHEETAVACIKALGLAPEDVRHIILTHLDYDHAAGIADLPWATAHVYAPEMHAALHGKSWRDRIRYDRRQLARHERWDIHDGTGGDSWYGLRKLRPIKGIGDEFALIPLIGHSAGHCGVAVRGEKRWLIHAGDAYMNCGELQPAPNGPASTGLFQPVMQADGVARKNSLRLLSELHRCHGDTVRVVSAHDKTEFTQCAEEAEEEAQTDA
jgi:glyoxylase-like metal-dependent hydrolase (beta-lactamase superfamily II)